MTQSAMSMLAQYPNIELQLNTNLSNVDPVIVSGTTIKAINTITNGSTYVKIIIEDVAGHSFYSFYEFMNFCICYLCFYLSFILYSYLFVILLFSYLVFWLFSLVV